MCLCVKTVITRRPPLLRAAHQELLSPHLSLRNAGEGEGEGDRLAEQPVTPDECWANERTGRSGATQPLLEDIYPTSRMRTAVYPHPSIHYQIVAQPPISAANENLPFYLGLELGKFPGLYKPADPDPRQDSTARPFRVKNSGSGISSSPYLQPYTKPFSERPARSQITCPTRGLELCIRCCRAPNARIPTLP